MWSTDMIRELAVARGERLPSDAEKGLLGQILLAQARARGMTNEEYPKERAERHYRRMLEMIDERDVPAPRVNEYVGLGLLRKDVAEREKRPEKERGTAAATATWEEADRELIDDRSR